MASPAANRGPSGENTKKILNIVSGIVSVVDVLELHKYTIPDYPVHKVDLVHIKVKHDRDDIILDAFMQALSSVVLSVPADIYVHRGFFLPVAETAGQLDCHKLHTAAGSVLVIHEWVVAQQDKCITSIPETPPTAMSKSIIQDSDHEHGSDESGSETEGYDTEVSTSPTSLTGAGASSCNEDECDSWAAQASPLHTVAFKAMGPTKIPGAQDILLAARDALDYGQNVPVELVPEPDNPKDNRAIAFRCFLKGQWHTFGYVVTELLEEVHGAIVRHEIIQTTFKTIKYMFTWTRCDHGFYAAVNVTKKGLGSSQVVNYGSTI